MCHMIYNTGQLLQLPNTRTAQDSVTHAQQMHRLLQSPPEHAECSLLSTTTRNKSMRHAHAPCCHWVLDALEGALH